jgi:hypothetical protein
MRDFCAVKHGVKQKTGWIKDLLSSRADGSIVFLIVVDQDTGFLVVG